MNRNFNRTVSRKDIERMEREAFDSFDPEIVNQFDPELVDNFDYEENGFDDDGFDEDGFDDEGFDSDGYTRGGIKGRRSAPRRSAKDRLKGAAQVDIVIDARSRTVDQPIELFNYLRSNSMMSNAAYAPLLAQTADNVAAAPTLTTNRIFWDTEGSLRYQAAPGDFVKISCLQVPFRTLHESSRTNPFQVTKMRFNYTTAGQIDRTITHFKNSFLGGIVENNISPRSSFNPNQFQPLIVDVDTPFTITQEHGLKYTINTLNSVTINMFIGKFQRSSAKA